jgi:hypothetical protein
LPEYLLAPALETLRAQFDQRFPGRNKASDGWIGDEAHRAQGSESDHNPWVVIDGQAYVTALDITDHPAIGLDLNAFTDQLLVACRDQGENRLKYMIFRALIMDTRPQFSPYQWTPSSGHFAHAHFSVHSDRRLLDGRVWNLPMLSGTAAPAADPAPTPAGHMFPISRSECFGLRSDPRASVHGGYNAWERPHVLLIQQALQRKGYAPSAPGWADGLYDQPTVDAVTRWQRDHMPGTTFWGQVWWDDWAKLIA